ncbi:MAG: TerC family protein [Dysgonamonadaceae bacterium]|jgi:predicted tellurium resistance membrane protein TerC|nr:TerC family protein [Dysgonamonadaceae bacterium]
MSEIISVLASPSAWLALLTLAFLEIVLGIDNIMFLSIMTNKLPKHQQKHGRFVGLGLAMIARILLLLCISLLMQLIKPLFSIDWEWLHCSVTGQSLIILAGGLFLLYKSVSEIHDKLEEKEHQINVSSKNSFSIIITEIVALDIVFSLDSVLTAVGMVSYRDYGEAGALFIMCLAIVVAIVIMMVFSGAVSRFVNEHPSIQMLALSFLILISVTLLIEAGHLSHLTIFDHKIEEVPKGYIYFAIGFSLLVETLNIKQNSRHRGKAKV